ncbi:MAG TPA: dihydrofolate reductase family protein [Anaerolineae bacterium]|nr:dihydrofolate reductase family protein [Anaerolineae bacterium]
MSTKVSVYIATSLDGFIARNDGGIDWLNEANATVPEGEDCGFQAFMDSVDALIMGRKTYEQVWSFGEWPYGRTPVVVLSRNPISFPPGVPATVTHSSEPPRDLLERLSKEGAEHVYVDGGTTIQGFLSESLIDEITVTVIPIILGDGIPLFGSIGREISLTHVHTTAFDFGFVQTTYSVKKKA